MQNINANRRQILAGIGIGISLHVLAACGESPAAAKDFPYQLSESQWRQRLSVDEFHILREAGTERPYTSPLDVEKRKGTFNCAGCAQALYSSEHKYDSRTGWPSFWRALPKAIGTATDYKIGIPRTEAHCSNCGGHLGHIFGDGPKPTGKRHCINGLALDFRPA